MNERHPRAIRPRSRGLIEEGNTGLTQLLHLFIQIRDLKANMVNAFPSLLQKFLEGISLFHALDEFDFSIPDGEKGDPCLFRLYHLGPLTVKPQHVFEEPRSLLHTPDRNGDVRHFFNHRGKDARVPSRDSKCSATLPFVQGETDSNYLILKGSWQKKIARTL